MTDKKINLCECLTLHKDIVLDAKKKLPEENLLRKIGDFFKILGDPTRLKIINALMLSEMCVCDLTAVLNMNQSAISHQLRTLRQANFVTFRKEGKIVYYSLIDEHIKHIYEEGFMHITGEKHEQIYN